MPALLQLLARLIGFAGGSALTGKGLSALQAMLAREGAGTASKGVGKLLGNKLVHGTLAGLGGVAGDVAGGSLFGHGTATEPRTMTITALPPQARTHVDDLRNALAEYGVDPDEFMSGLPGGGGML